MFGLCGLFMAHNVYTYSTDEKAVHERNHRQKGLKIKLFGVDGEFVRSITNKFPPNGLLGSKQSECNATKRREAYKRQRNIYSTSRNFCSSVAKENKTSLFAAQNLSLKGSKLDNLATVCDILSDG